jgi:hypothetical protein
MAIEPTWVIEEPAWLSELKEKLPKELHSFLDKRDGAALFLSRLPTTFSPEAVATPSNEQRYLLNK